MNKEDYNKFYIQGSDHYLIPKNIFNELFDEMSNWKEDTKKLKEAIDKAIEYYDMNKRECVIGRTKDEKLIKDYYLPAQLSKDLIKILKGDSNE